MRTLILSLALTLCVLASTADVESEAVSTSCKDDRGKSVDWFIMLKYPDSTDYVIATSANATFSPGLHPLSSKLSAFGKTLQRAYDVTSNTVMYNDEFPDEKKYSYGAHAKGVITWRGSRGYWLLHSIPSYPPADRFEGCCPSTTYGQSAICITLDRQGIDQALSYMMVAVPHLYLNNTDYWPTNIPDSPYVDSMKSVGGQKFTIFSREGPQRIDLYETLVAPNYKFGLMTETWQNGRGKTPSDCTSNFTVVNIGKVSVLGQDFHSTQDHSKWAIAGTYGNPDAPTHPVCIGDINRQNSQVERGGGTICLDHQEIWTQFKAFVAGAETCHNSP